MSGTALAQIVGYALSPIISRLYSPADFGVYGSFSAILGVISAGITLDYSLAIMLPKRKEEAFGLFILSCIATIVVGVIILTICLFFPSTVQSAIKAPNSWMLGLLVIGVLASGLNQGCQAWCVRVKAFKHTSASQVVRSLSTNGTQVGLGYMKGGPSALIFATILGDVLASLNLARVVFRDLRTILKNFQWNRIWKLAKDYSDFPLYSASMNVINAISLGLPVFLLTHFFGIAMAGAYAFTIRILSAPMGLVQKALRQVLYQKACETQNAGGRLLPLYLKFTSGLFILALFPALILFIWSPQLFSWIFGSQWQIAGVFARSLVLWLMLMLCNLPANLFSRVVRIQRQMFFFDLTVLALRTLALIAGGLYLSASSTVMLFSLVGAVMNILYIFIIGVVLRRKEGELAWKEVLNGLKEGQL
jgi:O-antigen/teichoic acid export membrane protein